MNPRQIKYLFLVKSADDFDFFKFVFSLCVFHEIPLVHQVLNLIIKINCLIKLFLFLVQSIFINRHNRLDNRY